MENKFLNAVRAGDLAAMDLALKNGADKDFQGSGGTAIYEAASSGKLDVLNKLIGAGVDLEKGKEQGRTPLMEAAFKGRLMIVKRMLEAGADPDAQDNDGCTVLMTAVKRQDPILCDAILDFNTKLDIVDGNSKTALLHALDIPLPDMMLQMAGKLLEAGADTEAQDAECKTALIRAVEKKNLDMVKLLLLNYGAQLERQDEDGCTALLVAVKLRIPKIVHRLLRLKAKTNTADKFNRTALITAVMKGDLEIVEMLLQAGADVELSDSDYKTPLFLAAELNRCSIVEKLLAAGAVTHKRDKFGRSALEMTCNEAIKKLLRTYADKEAKRAAQEGTDDQSLAISGMSSDFIGIRDGQSLGLSLGLQSVGGGGSVASAVSAGFGNDFDGLILEDTASTADTVEDEQCSKHQRTF